MQEIRRRRAVAIGLRARLPYVARIFALVALTAGIAYVGISYYKNRNNQPFRMFSRPAVLSKQVISEVKGYERRVTGDDGHLRVLLRAGSDITYADGHHELEDVHLEVFPSAEGKPDRISARRSIYDQENRRISFSGDVDIETRDALTAKTEAIVYDEKSEVAETNAPITFARDNIVGSATGALVDAKNKSLELRSSVEVTVTPDVKTDGAVKPNSRARPVKIRAARATFDQFSMRLTFSGGATAEQDRDIMSGENLSAVLNQQKQLQKVESRRSAYLRSMTEGRAAEVSSADMDFFLDEDQQLQRAVATRDVRARSLDADAEMQLTGANSVEVNFQPQGERSLLKEMRADGRSILTLAAPKSRSNDPRAANKRLTADSVKIYWRASGRDIERAEAMGNAELFVDPVQKSETADRKQLTASRFDCEFYETGNLARVFNATGDAKALIDPIQPTQERAARTLTSQKMAAIFFRDTQDVERLDAETDAKFNERDRHGRAANVSYTAADEMVRLRGGDPTVWDSRARLKATELDADTRSDISHGRGKTATTYYSQEQTNGATPFAKVKSPVYIVSDRAEFRHSAGVAVYTGNARAWQDDNFVRANRLTIYRENKRLEGDGEVQNALYQTRRKNANGVRDVVPVFATSDRMWYSDADRILHYEGNVDIKQGTERITSGVADVHLLRESNEVEKTIMQRNVVVTQPGRQGHGDWAQYTTADETVILKGAPARVEDRERGSMESGRLTVYLRDSRVVADDAKGAQSPGRVRSTHPIRKQ